MGIWQDLVDGYGFAGGYQSGKRFVRQLRGMRSPEARVVIETSPGEEAQMDYGSGLPSETNSLRFIVPLLWNHLCGNTFCPDRVPNTFLANRSAKCLVALH